METEEIQNRRNLNRLHRQPEHLWQLSLDEDGLITRNINNISPGGLSFKAPATVEFKYGQLVPFKLKLNGGSELAGQGRIMWTKDQKDKLGQMKIFGMQFLNITPRHDELFMREINQSLMREKQAKIVEGAAISALASRKVSGDSIRATLSSILGSLVAAVLMGALFAALWLHEHTHPQNSIAETFNKALARKLSSTTNSD